MDYTQDSKQQHSSITRSLFGFSFLMILFALPASALSSTLCLNENTTQHNISQIIITNGTQTNITTSEEINCVNGCSTTSGNCRPDAYDSWILFFMLIGFDAIAIVFLMWSSARVKEKKIMDTGFVMLTLFLTGIGALTDTFTGYLKTLLLVIGMLNIAIMLYNKTQQRTHEEENE